MSVATSARRAAAAAEIHGQRERPEAELAAEDRMRDAAYAHRAALSCDLKAYVREEIAELLHDPPVMS